MSALALFFGLLTVVGVYNHYSDKWAKKRQELEAQKRKELIASSLTGIRAAVFIRQPNGSRTALERHVEQEFISRGAEVLVANEEAGNSIRRLGVFQPLSPDGNVSFIGTLIIKENVLVKLPNEEDEAYRQISSLWRAEHKEWKIYDEPFHRPEPVRPLPPMEEKQVTIFQLLFELIDNQGTKLTSGNIEQVTDAGKPSYDDTLREMAHGAFASLDNGDVWNNISVRSLTLPAN